MIAAILCIVGAVVFFLVVMPAMNVAGSESEAERNAEALERLTRK